MLLKPSFITLSHSYQLHNELHT